MGLPVKTTYSRTVPVRLVCTRCAARFEYDRVLSDERKVTISVDLHPLGSTAGC